VRIGPREVLLPQDADLRTTGADGEEHRNVIAFTHCRGFSTESTVHFDDAAPAAESVVSVPKPVGAEGTLPQGLRISVALRTPLNDETSV